MILNELCVAACLAQNLLHSAGSGADLGEIAKINAAVELIIENSSQIFMPEQILQRNRKNTTISTTTHSNLNSNNKNSNNNINHTTSTTTTTTTTSTHIRRRFTTRHELNGRGQ